MEPPRTITNGSTDRRPWLWAVLLAVIVAAVFGRVLSHGFSIWDDEAHVVDNPHLDPVSWRSLKRLWTQPYFGLYVPLSYTFFAAEASIAPRVVSDDGGWEPSPTVFHAGNLLLHVAAVLLVFAILRRLVKHDAAALFGALLFALHPVQVESVAWISETRGLLCAVFSLLAIWGYLDAAARPQWDRRALRRYLAASLALLLALLSKPAAVAVPLIVGLLDLAWLQRDIRRVLPLVGPWLGMAAVWVVITRGVQQAPLTAEAAPWWARPLVAGDALAFYLMKLAVPWPLCIDYGRSPPWVMEHAWVYVAWLVPVALAALLAWLPGRRVWLVAAGLFAVWLLPVLGLVPFAFQRISTVADRYLYLALLGPALAVAWLLARYWSRWTVAVASAVLCVLAGLSVIQSGYWRDDLTLLHHTLEVNPRSLVAHQNLGALRARAGDDEGAVEWYRKALPYHPRSAELRRSLGTSLVDLGKLGEGLAELREAVRLDPRLPTAHLHLADALRAQGKVDEALKEYQEALKYQPEYPLVYFAIGQTLYNQGAVDQAIEQYRKAIEIAPGYVDAHVNLGVALKRRGDVAGARRHYLAALAVRPDDASAHFNLGNLALDQPGGAAEAIEHYHSALKYAPNYAMAHVNLGIALRSLGRDLEAIEHFQTARRIDPKLLEAHANLGIALLDAGRRDEAQAALREALRLAPPGSSVAGRLQEILSKL